MEWIRVFLEKLGGKIKLVLGTNLMGGPGGAGEVFADGGEIDGH
jgi:hypothetical protein